MTGVLRQRRRAPAVRLERAIFSTMIATAVTANIGRAAHFLGAATQTAIYVIFSSEPEQDHGILTDES